MRSVFQVADGPPPCVQRPAQGVAEDFMESARRYRVHQRFATRSGRDGSRKGEMIKKRRQRVKLGEEVVWKSRAAGKRSGHVWAAVTADHKWYEPNLLGTALRPFDHWRPSRLHDQHNHMSLPACLIACFNHWLWNRMFAFPALRFFSHLFYW